MDPTILTTPSFWDDREPFSFGKFHGQLPIEPLLESTVLFETSGSSGKPKWVVISKSALLASAAAVNEHLEISSSSCWGLALPLHHVGGFGIAARSYAASCKLRVFPQRWDAPAFADWLGKNAVTHSSLVPTQVHDLVKNRLVAPSCLQAIIVGGGRLDSATGHAARALGWPVLASYGMTEAASQVATQGLSYLNDHYQPSPIPILSNWQARVVTNELLEVSGPALFSGYVTLENGVGHFTPRSSSWYITSDRVLLEDRLLSPLGRADTLVKVLGELVDPSEIEQELRSLAEGRLAIGSYAVLAVPDARAGHRLVPVFERQVAPELVAAVLAKYALLALGFRRLQPCFWIDTLPKSPLGKILKTKLLSRFENRDLPDS